MMLAGDEFYGDDVTGERIATVKPVSPLPRSCAWCEDYGDGMDPDPCPDHSEPAS